MKDLEIILENKPGALALLGEILGKNEISLEGGGVFSRGNDSVAHFLVEAAEDAKDLLTRAGINVVSINEVLIVKLRQDVPGQLGMFCRRMADAHINIITQYSDHDNHLILVVDNILNAVEISREWMKEWWSGLR